MTFGAPLALLALTALPLLAAWYAGRQRGRRRQQAAFVAAPLTASVAPNRPGWRRHLPVIAMLAALAALIVAFAEPRTTNAESVPRTAIMIATDVSGSMGATDVQPTRLRAVLRAARDFLDTVPNQVRVGVMVFDQATTVLQSPTTDRAADRRALNGWRPHGGTAIGSAIDRALGELAPYGGGSTRSRPTASILLLSDGGSTSGVDPLTAARTAAARHIPVDTVALGTPGGRIAVKVHGRTITVPVPPQPQLLAAVARTSHGETFQVQDAKRLAAVYTMLGAKLGHRKVTRTLEAGFAGAALALLALGGAMSLRWFGRLI